MVAPRDVHVLPKKEGGGQDLPPCPGGSGTNTLTYLLTQARREMTTSPCTAYSSTEAPKPSEAPEQRACSEASLLKRA